MSEVFVKYSSKKMKINIFESVLPRYLPNYFAINILLNQKRKNIFCETNIEVE